MDGTVLCTKSGQTVNTLQGLSVVIPVYNEDPRFLTETYCELSLMGAEVIIVNDGNTVDLPDDINQVRYVPNMGYGYAIKRGIERATNQTVMTIDGDSQHQIKDVLKLYQVFKLRDDLAMVVGSRWNIHDSSLRWIFRKCINFVASIISSHYQTDLNSGMRVFRRDIAIGYKSILCDTFSFTTSLTMSIVTDGYKIVYFPIDVLPRKYGKSSVKLFKDGMVTLYYVVWIGLALRTRKLRSWIRHLLGQ